MVALVSAKVHTTVQLRRLMIHDGARAACAKAHMLRALGTQRAHAGFHTIV